MRKLLLIIIIISMLIGGVSAYTGGLSGYNNRIQFNLTGSASWAGNQTNYPVYFTISNATGVSTVSTCYLNGTSHEFPDDIQITQEDGTTLVPFYYRDDAITNSTIGVYANISNLLKTGSTLIYVYTNNPDHVNNTWKSNIGNTFTFGDDWGTSFTTAANIYSNIAEVTAIQDPTNSSLIDIWGTGEEARESGKVYYMNTSDPNMQTGWSAKVATDLPTGQCAFPSVYYDAPTSKYYALVQNWTASPKAYYLYNSTNKINWIKHTPNPVLTQNTTVTSNANLLFNTAMVNVSGVWHLVVEGDTQAGGDATAGLLYSYSNLTECNWTAHLNETKQLSPLGQPRMQYLPDKNVLMVLCGKTTNNAAWSTSNRWVVGGAYGDLSTTPPTWNWLPGIKIDVGHTTIDATDPAWVVTNYTRNYNIGIFYLNQQTTIPYVSNGAYSNESINSFFEHAKGTNATINTTKWTVYGVPYTHSGVLKITADSAGITSVGTFSNTSSIIAKNTFLSTNGKSGFFGFGTSGPRGYSIDVYGNYPTANKANSLKGGATGADLGNDGTTPHFYIINRSTSNAGYIVDGVLRDTRTGTSTAVLYIHVTSDGAGALNYMDWITGGVSYIYPEPGYGTHGAIETKDSGTILPVASFTSNWAGSLPISRSIAFTDTSTNTPASWQWSMGDGTANQTTQNVTYHYTKRGYWTVVMTATNSAGSSSASTQVRVVGG